VNVLWFADLLLGDLGLTRGKSQFTKCSISSNACHPRMAAPPACCPPRAPLPSA
jgi:hypothetical protein